ncbi:hypothetical protein FKM82_013219, partial [Ascaphus truei]
MSGRRMVSSVQITLAPPWRAETARKIQQADTLHVHQAQHAEPVPRRTKSPPSTPPDLLPPADGYWSEHGDFSNGDMPSFPHSFLDEIPTVESFLSRDLTPPPPPPPSLIGAPKLILPDPSPSHLTDTLSLELQKLDLAYPPALQKPNSVTPTVSKPVKNMPANQQKREDAMPAKQSLNGHTGKPDSADICAFCHKAILPHAAAIEAMKKQYHADCFTCRKCHRLLAGQLYYQMDGQPICDLCYKVWCVCVRVRVCVCVC